MKVTWTKKSKKWDESKDRWVDDGAVFTGEIDPDSKAWKQFLKTVKASKPKVYP